MVYIIIFEEGMPYYIPVNLDNLPETLKDLYLPYENKYVCWSPDGIKEWKP